MNYAGKYTYVDNSFLKEKAAKQITLFENIEKNYPTLYKSFYERFPYIEDIKKGRVLTELCTNLNKKIEEENSHNENKLKKMLDKRTPEEFIYNYYLRSLT